MKHPPQALAALQSIPGIGRQRISSLLKGLQGRRTSLREFWRTPQKYASMGLVGMQEMTELVAKFKEKWSLQGYWDFLLERQVKVITYQDDEYPALLKETSDYPLVLFAKGALDCLKPTQVAIVGSRRPTRYGQWVTQKIVAELAQHQASITSGFMVGIDFQAHQTAQVLGMSSVGVLGFGFGKFYPMHLVKAAEEFLAAGKLFITEYPPDHSPAPGQFPARNRIVAGLAKATVVVEAQQKSGSLITAQCALDANRVVCAVPGPVDSAQSHGTNELLRQGATLIRGGEDIWQEISIET